MSIIGKLKRENKALRQMVTSLRPSSSPNMLTSHTTRGVVRTPIQSRKQTSNSNNGGVARWA
ncbi:MAG: hypothetical protein ABS95_01085 [Verrucomicrobia bacterium SCN 57-15]|nr:MAG: hypothetical protein ABS95_01085 [Verrucomicrobia bacterium SCN 57-15]